MLSAIFAAAMLWPTLPPLLPAGELSSTDDCAIFAVVARERLAFGHSRALDDGPIGSYLIRCDWPSLGMTDPSQIDHAPTSDVVFTQPTYGSGRKGAMVGYTIRHYGHHWDVHRVTSTEAFTCALKRRPEGWTLVECKPGLPD